ncbi:hypothetical protein ZWY2020_028646 [Hordeum vulgare]|nr:hypothetical protein ZWY2020_028646 [Hordeum vulgare]
MNVKFPKTVSELYTLEDKCAQAEEGRRVLGKEAGVRVHSDDDDDTPGPKGRNRKRNKKRKGKEVLDVEGSRDLSAGNKAKAKNPGKGDASCADCREATSTEKTGKSNGPNCKIHRTKGHGIQECRQVEQLAEKKKVEYEKRNKEKGQDGAIGKGHGGRGGRHGKAPHQEKPAIGREMKEVDKMSDDEDDAEDSNDKEFEIATDPMHVCLRGYILALLLPPSQTVGTRS